MAYLPLRMEGLTLEMENVAERELGETPQVKKASLEKIKQLIEKLQNIMETNCYVDMPRRDVYLDGRNAVIWRLGQSLRTKIAIEELFAACLTVGILANRIEATSVCGILLIFDFKDFSLQDIFKFASPKFLMFFLNCIQVFMHGKNLEDLHKYLPPEILPEELEGAAGPLDSTEFYNNALSQESFFKEMVKCGFRRKSTGTPGR